MVSSEECLSADHVCPHHAPFLQPRVPEPPGMDSVPGKPPLSRGHSRSGIPEAMTVFLPCPSPRGPPGPCGRVPRLTHDGVVALWEADDELVCVGFPGGCVNLFVGASTFPNECSP